MFNIESNLVKKFLVVGSTFTSKEVYGETYLLTKMRVPILDRLLLFNQPSMIKVNNNKFMVMIVKCTASDSHFAEVGGFIQLLQRSVALILDSTFSRMSAMIGGVISVSQNSMLQIEKCTFMNNRAGQAGGVFLISDLSGILGK